MIPSIETIAEDLAAGRINIAQAIAWLHQHAAGSANELRDHFAAAALPGLLVRNWADPVTGETPANVHELWACGAYKTADAMMVARTAR